jgi:hypothetical protein
VPPQIPSSVSIPIAHAGGDVVVFDWDAAMADNSQNSTVFLIFMSLFEAD